MKLFYDHWRWFKIFENLPYREIKKKPRNKLTLNIYTLELHQVNYSVQMVGTHDRINIFDMYLYIYKYSLYNTVQDWSRLVNNQSQL
jgi:hypothetical protein